MQPNRALRGSPQAPIPMNRTDDSEEDEQIVDENSATAPDSDGENRPESHAVAGESDASLPGGSEQTGMPETLSTPEEFDWSGWIVVLVVFLSFLVIPAFILYLPEAHWLLTMIGFSWRQAYVAFPMIPAILLGITAIWSALRSHSN